MGSTDTATAAYPALRSHPRFIFFTDFDGTVTKQDSNDFLTDNLGFGLKERKKANHDVLVGRRRFRDAFRDQLGSISAPFDKCKQTLLDIIVPDDYFKDFYLWCKQTNIPVVLLSGGMRPNIEALMAQIVGPEEAKNIQIVSNDVEARPGKSINDENGWQIVFHDDSPYGHDKSIEIRKYSKLPENERPVIFYAGDGVSDLSAAREADLMFAKAGMDLVTYCETEGLPFTEFEDFKSIHTTVQAIVEGKMSVKDVAGKTK